MAIHFLADLHLDEPDGEYSRILVQYLDGLARNAEAVYVLGDLFEVWIGDDGSLPRHRSVMTAFARLSDSGVPVFFIRGNRDFAVGTAFEQAGGITILDDPTVIDLYGTATLLSHGDMLCTDDVAHQRFRAKYTDPAWRRHRLALPLWLRRAVARYARGKSRHNKGRKEAHIMDVNADAVCRIMTEHGVRQLIHGHTHRPDRHDFTLQGTPACRLVLPDWRPQHTGIVIADDNGMHTHWLHDAPAS